MFSLFRRAIAISLVGFAVQPVGAQAQVEGAGVSLKLTGFVRDELTGRPLPGATVSARGRAWRTITDESGRYVIEGMQPALDRATSVQAYLPGYLPEEGLMVLGCHWLINTSVCDLSLSFSLRPWETTESESPNCTVSGSVRGSRGPMRVSTRVRGNVSVDGVSMGTVADSDGEFVLRGVPAGLHRLTASHLGYLPHQRLVIVSCESAEGGPRVEFRLNPVRIE